MKKAQTNTIIILLSALAILSIFTGVYLHNKEQKTITGRAIVDLEKQLEEQGKLTAEQERQLEELAEVTCKKVQVPYEAQESYEEQEPYTTEECETINLEYSKTNEEWDYSDCVDYDTICHTGHNNFWGNWVCDDEETFCVERKLSYSIDINNQDSKNGIWGVEIKFYLDGELYEKKEMTQLIYPKTSKTFTGMHVVYSDSPSGDANQGVGATSFVTSIPTKTICETVTKYRAVTKYRTITKYKTETICE